MSYYQQQHDPRNFAYHPQFPEPQKSSSWVGWLLMVIAALIAGFFAGQTVKVEVHPKNDDHTDLNDNHLTSATIVDEKEEEPKNVEPEAKINEPVMFTDLSDEIIHRYTEDFDNLNQAERLFCKREFEINPELITRYPILAKLLGFDVEENDDNQPL